MSFFGGQELFGSGPHRFEIGGLALRHTLHEPAGSSASRGAFLQSNGLSTRKITQTGELLADDPAAMKSLVDAIEATLDGQAHELVDDRGVAWPDTVMIEFTPQPISRVGTRWHTPYRIEYMQVTP